MSWGLAANPLAYAAHRFTTLADFTVTHSELFNFIFAAHWKQSGANVCLRVIPCSAAALPVTQGASHRATPGGTVGKKLTFLHG